MTADVNYDNTTKLTIQYYSSVFPGYCNEIKDAAGYIVVFDWSLESSIDVLDLWLELVRRHANTTSAIYLVGINHDSIKHEHKNQRELAVEKTKFARQVYSEINLKTKYLSTLHKDMRNAVSKIITDHDIACQIENKKLVFKTCSDPSWDFRIV